MTNAEAERLVEASLTNDRCRIDNEHGGDACGTECQSPFAYRPGLLVQIVRGSK